MIRSVFTDFCSNWRALLATDLVMKVVAFAILTPLVSLAFDAFLGISGRRVLADADIAHFLLHPVGWCAAIVVGGGALAILAMEQAALMTIVLAKCHGKSIGTIASLRFVADQSVLIFQLTWRLVARILVVAAPFFVVGGGIYLTLLTKHDINFYLSEQPPVFWVATTLIATVILAMVFTLLRLLAGWAFTLQLCLYDGVTPRGCFDESRHLALGQRLQIGTWIGAWFVCGALASAVVTTLVAVAGQFVVEVATASLWSMILAVGTLLIVWSLSNLLIHSISVSSLSVILMRLFISNPNRNASLPDLNLETGGRISIRLTRWRIVAVLAIGCVVAMGLGAHAIHSVELVDHVQVTAHRGASGKAPENTLAAVEQAIADRTDWVEIDVQESKDGVVIVAHDSDLKKVSGVDTKIWNGTAEELRSIDIGTYFDPKFASERVPTLAEVLDACRGRSKLNIELKYYGHDQELEQRVIDLVEEHKMEQDVVLMSLELQGVQVAKRLRPDWTIGLLTAVAIGDLTRADADFFAVNTKVATASFIQAAHRKGKQVYVWTVNDPVVMSVMISRGVDNIITDYPDVARHVLAERAAMSPVERMMLELAVLLDTTPPYVPQ